MKRVLPWIILVAVLVGGVYLYAKWRGDLKVLEERIKGEKAAAEALKTQIKDQADLTAKIEATLLKVQSDATARENWYQTHIVTQVAAATPQQLVDEGSRILVATDIKTDGKIVTMGVETWRKAVKVMLNEEEYRLHREPAYKNQIDLSAQTIAGLKQEIVLHVQREAALEATTKDLSKAIVTQKQLSIFEKFGWGAGGFVLGKGIDALVTLLKGK